MPYKHSTDHLKIPLHKDKRVKLSAEQREEIRENKLGLSQRALARQYNVSRRTIQFILDPAKKEANLEARARRGGSKHYYEKYGKEYHAEIQRTHRKHKQQLYLNGDLLED